MASYEEGGLENHFIDLVTGLAALGYEVHVVVDQRYSARFGAGVQVHTTDFTRTRNHPLLLWQVACIIRSIAPDVVHCHAGKATHVVGWVKRWLPCPCVATIHNLKSDKGAFRTMNAVIGVSKGVLAGVQNPRKKAIYNGIMPLPAEQLLPDLPAFSRQLPTVLAVGRLVPVKGFDLLLEAWQRVDANLILIGDGPQRETLARQIETAGLAERVKLLGFVPQARRFLPRADLLVISSHREGFNYVLAEALQLGVPVVSTDVPAPNELLPKEYLVSVGSAVALADKVNEVLTNLDSCKKELQPLFDWAANVLTQDTMVQETADYLQEVISQ